MSNPWLKKNPFMSMWLGTAHRITGTLRGQATAQVKRQLNAAVTELARDNLKLWTDGVKPAAVKTKRRR